MTPSRRLCRLLAVLSLGAALVACTGGTPQQGARAWGGAGVGAGTGIVIGLLIGGNAAVGAILGAAAGAAIGAFTHGGQAVASR